MKEERFRKEKFLLLNKVQQRRAIVLRLRTASSQDARAHPRIGIPREPTSPDIGARAKTGLNEVRTVQEVSSKQTALYDADASVGVASSEARKAVERGVRNGFANSNRSYSPPHERSVSLSAPREGLRGGTSWESLLNVPMERT